MAWNLFNDDGQNQEKLHKNSGNAWDDFWSSLNRPIKVGPLDKGVQSQIAGQGYGFSNRDQMGDLYERNQANGVENARAEATRGFPAPQSKSMGLIRSLDTSRLPGMSVDTSNGMTRQGNDPTNEREVSYEEKLLERKAQIEMLMDTPYADDPEIAAMIDEAYSGALANISKARDSANSNFQQSDANIAALTAGHVNTIKTDDLAAVNRIAGEYQGGLQKTFDTAKQGLESNRSAELAERTAMLQRLGIQEAGLGEAGKGETEAISRMTEDQAGAMKQAQGYQAADQVRNTEQAQSQASAGVERRSALNSDLQKILGTIDNSETELRSNMNMDKLSARQKGLDTYNDQQRFNLDSLNQIDETLQNRADSDRDYDLELRKLAEKNSGSSGGVFDAVANDFRTRGLAPEEYEQAYSQVASSATFNAAVDGDKQLWMIRQMKKKNPKLAENDIARYVSGIQNYGTDKLGN